MCAQEIQGTFFDLTPQKVPFKQWQIREGNRLYCNGVNQLGDTELLAHVVRDQHIAEELMRHFSSLEKIADASIDELKQIAGVGNALAEVIITALEFGRRALRIRERDFDTAGNPEAIYDLFKYEMGMLYQEEMRVLHLDIKNQIRKIETVFVGTLDSAVIHPREIFKSAIRASSKSIILVHNHPSGNPAPSSDDLRITKQFVEVGKLVEISVLDHIIITKGGYYSFEKENQI